MTAQPLVQLPPSKPSGWTPSEADVNGLLTRARMAFEMPLKTGQIDLSGAIMQGRVVLAIRDDSKAAQASENPTITNALVQHIVGPLGYDLVETVCCHARVYYEFERA